MSTKNTILFILIFLLAKPIFSQRQFMWQLSDMADLPSSNINDIIQSNDGNIWIATNKGICKFDGKTIFNCSSASLKNKTFYKLIQDSSGTIWSVNLAGQIIFIQDDSLRIFTEFEKYSNSKIPAIEQDYKKGLLFIATEGQPIFQYNISKHTLTHLTGLLCDFKTNLFSDNNGNIFANSDNTIWKIAGNHVLKSQFTGKIISSIGSNQLLIYTDSKMQIFNTQNKSIKPLNGEISNYFNSKFSVLNVSPSENWLINNEGGFSFNENGDILNKIRFNSLLTTVIKDKYGKYWLGSATDGVYIMPSPGVWIINKDNSPITTNRICCLSKDDEGNLIIGVDVGEIFLLNTKTKKIANSLNITNSKSKSCLWVDFEKRAQSADKYGSVFYDLRKKALLIEDSRLESAGKYSFDRYGNYVFTNSESVALVRKSEKTNCGLTKKFSYNKYKGRDVHILRNQKAVDCLINEHDSSIWVAYIDGLYKYSNGKSHEIIDPKTKLSIYANQIISDENGIVWVASSIQKGLLGINESDQIQYRIDKSSGLESNSIRCMTISEKEIWFATDKSVYVYDPFFKTLSSFSKEDGLVSTEIFSIVVVGPDVYLATSKGLQWFDMSLDFTNKVVPKVEISEVLVNLNPHKSITNDFEYTQNSFIFQFSTFSFMNREKMRYAYRLLGLDSSWTYTAISQAEARFPNLMPGVYTFQVKAINEDGFETITPTNYHFSISAPFWRKTWFYVLMLIGFVSSVILIYRIRLENAKIKMRQEQEKYKLELDVKELHLSALKVQMNPHFIFNALNSIQDYILSNDKGLASKYLGKFSQLIRAYLDMSNKTSVLLDEEIKVTQLYLDLEAMRFENSFSYDIEIDNKIDTREISIPPMLIQPYAENAIKHGLRNKKTGIRHLKIRFCSVSDSVIKCEIIDNGIGLKKSAEINTQRSSTHKSFATKATQKRLELLNEGKKETIVIEYESLYDEFQNPTGTKVSVIIPTYFFMR